MGYKSMYSGKLVARFGRSFCLHENRALLGNYTANNDNFLSTFRIKMSVQFLTWKI